MKRVTIAAMLAALFATLASAVEPGKPPKTASSRRTTKRTVEANQRARRLDFRFRERSLDPAPIVKFSTISSRVRTRG
jgi:hypothetical protein